MYVIFYFIKMSLFYSLNVYTSFWDNLYNSNGINKCSKEKSHTRLGIVIENFYKNLESFWQPRKCSWIPYWFRPRECSYC